MNKIQLAKLKIRPSTLCFLLSATFTGAFLFSQLTKVSVQISSLSVGFSFDNLDFGRVFPEEKLEKNVVVGRNPFPDTKVTLDCPPSSMPTGSTGEIKITLVKGGVTGYGLTKGTDGLCPSLTLKKIGESGGVDFSTLSPFDDVTDDFVVALDTPCIQGYVPQGENCVTVPSGGDYSCNVSVDEIGLTGQLTLDLDEYHLEAVPISDPSRDYNAGTGEVRWNVPILKNDESIIFTLSVKAKGVGSWIQQDAEYSSYGETISVSGCGGSTTTPGTSPSATSPSVTSGQSSYEPSVLGAATEALLGAETGGGWLSALLGLTFLGLGLYLRRQSTKAS